MSGNPKCRMQRGIGLFEFAAAVAIIGVFGAVLLERMLYLEEYAEMTAMELTVLNMRTGLRYRTADFLVRDKVSEIATLADENPVNWLQNRPESYLGDFDLKPDTDLRGKWYFDKSRHELVYTVNNRRHFLPAGDQNYEFRWLAVPMQAKEAGLSAGKSNEQWVKLVQVSGGRWF